MNTRAGAVKCGRSIRDSDIYDIPLNRGVQPVAHLQ